jgi:hypothetical protein
MALWWESKTLNLAEMGRHPPALRVMLDIVLKSSVLSQQERYGMWSWLDSTVVNIIIYAVESSVFVMKSRDTTSVVASDNAFYMHIFQSLLSRWTCQNIVDEILWGKLWQLIMTMMTMHFGENIMKTVGI